MLKDRYIKTKLTKDKINLTTYQQLRLRIYRLLITIKDSNQSIQGSLTIARMILSVNTINAALTMLDDV